LADGPVIDIEGFEVLDRLLAGASVALQTSLVRELRADGEYILEAAKELCPVESGDITMTIDFGVDPYIFYAEDQHENLLYAHKPGKSAKFLEIPFMEWLSEGGPQSVADRAIRVGFLSGGGRV
jgi:hypothetical protein